MIRHESESSSSVIYDIVETKDDQEKEKQRLEQIRLFQEANRQIDEEYGKATWQHKQVAGKRAKKR